MRVGLVRPAERVGDDARAQMGHPEVVGIDAVGQACPTRREDLVGHVPLPDLAAEVADLGGDVLLEDVAELALLIVPLFTPVVSQAGSWLCHNRVWPRTSWPCCSANFDQFVARTEVELPRVGSTTSHFITFSGVTVLYWLATSEVYAALTLSLSILTALPMRRLIGAASARSESAGGRNGAGPLSGLPRALAAVAPASTVTAAAAAMTIIKRALFTLFSSDTDGRVWRAAARRGGGHGATVMRSIHGTGSPKTLPPVRAMAESFSGLADTFDIGSGYCLMRFGAGGWFDGVAADVTGGCCR